MQPDHICSVTEPTQAATSRDVRIAGPERTAEALRRARLHRGWSLRDVERMTSRPNAYLSQVERGIIRRPDPAIIWQLADLYALNFDLLMEWSGHGGARSSDSSDDPTVSALIRQVVELDESQRAEVMAFLGKLSHEGNGDR